MTPASVADSNTFTGIFIYPPTYAVHPTFKGLG